MIDRKLIRFLKRASSKIEFEKGQLHFITGQALENENGYIRICIDSTKRYARVLLYINDEKGIFKKVFIISYNKYIELCMKLNIDFK